MPHEASVSSPPFSFTPNINFISESDPFRVFSPPQPSAAGKEPLPTVSEGKQLRDALLQSIGKCVQIQNSLYRLVLLKVKVHVKPDGQTDSHHTTACASSKALNSEVSRKGSNDVPSALLCELKEPLESLMRCADIQRSLFQRLITMNSIAADEFTDHIASLPSSGEVICQGWYWFYFIAYMYPSFHFKSAMLISRSIIII